MSKKKSMAHQRKNTRFSTGVQNYKNMQVMGIFQEDVPNRRRIRMFQAMRKADRTQHERDIESGVDFSLVGLVLSIHPLMSLSDAKCEALTLQRAMHRRTNV